MASKITINREQCVGCGACAGACPDVFELGLDVFKARVIEKWSKSHSEAASVGEIPNELYDCAKAAADICPVGAIVVEKA